MPDLHNREAREREIALAVWLILQEHQRRAVEAPETFSAAELERSVASTLTTRLEAIYIAGAIQLAAELGMTVDRAELAGEARSWAVGYAAGVAEGMASNIAAAVADALERAKAEQLAAVALAAILAGVFSPARAESIGVTETTSAAVRGEQAAVERFESATGETLIPIWQTEDDERVCPICAPLDDQRVQVWSDRFPAGPPAHPRCRCWLTYERVA